MKTFTVFDLQVELKLNFNRFLSVTVIKKLDPESGCFLSLSNICNLELPKNEGSIKHLIYIKQNLISTNQKQLTNLEVCNWGFSRWMD